ncbi:hypothetical protein C8Q70DRAFT_954875 [Cubamyces menziesii]|nr:hypothetical protein C8Q70DRAFT_954875 [Cubamyces menziesii]
MEVLGARSPRLAVFLFLHRSMPTNARRGRHACYGAASPRHDWHLPHCASSREKTVSMYRLMPCWFEGTHRAAC